MCTLTIHRNKNTCLVIRPANMTSGARLHSHASMTTCLHYLELVDIAQHYSELTRNKNAGYDREFACVAQWKSDHNAEYSEVQSNKANLCLYT